MGDNFDTVLGKTMKAYEKDLMANITGRGLSVEAIRAMSMDEYAKVRNKLLNKEWVPKTEQEKVDCTCMWCGGLFPEGLDEHELECGV